MDEQQANPLTVDPAEDDQVFYRRADEVELEPEITDTERYQGELATDPDRSPHFLADTDLRAGETADPSVAAEEGLAWVPPMDPPVVPSADDPQGIEMAAGFGMSALAEPYDPDHPTDSLAAEDQTSSLVRDALRADAATSRYADELAIGTVGPTVALRGVVDDLDDSDNVIEVASRVVGIDNVIDELEIRALW